jgi:methionine biosynthesis protein MetW
VKVREVLGRGDYALISALIPEGARVLDLGCGDGALLAWLKENKRVEGRGIEIRPELAQRAASRGVPVYQGDLESSLGEYPDLAFDFVILSQTVQELRRPLQVIEQMLRIGRHAIVAFPNFGHWRVRLNHLFSGRAPRTPLFPHSWHDSPNIHFLTVLDFEETAAERNWRIEKRLFLSGHSQIRFAPNWRAEVAVYQICRQAPR